MGYTVKLDTTGGKDVWTYTFQLARQIEPAQDSIVKALAHPTADELDDWKDYRWEKAKEKGGNLLSLRWGESYQEEKRANEKGYFGPSSGLSESLLRGEVD